MYIYVMQEQTVYDDVEARDINSTEGTCEKWSKYQTS